MLRQIAAASLAMSALAASDTVLTNGHIYTANPKQPWVQAIAISGDKIDAVGGVDEIARHKTAATKVIDLGGRTVIPGIIDGHVHLWFGTLALHGFNLSTPESNVTPKDSALLVSKIKAYAASHPDDPIVYGRAQFITDFSPDTSSFKKPLVTHKMLDRAVPDRPLVIHDTSEHALWVNQKALDLAHITDEPWRDPSLDANILRDSQGHPTGVLMESAAEILEQALPDPPENVKVEWLTAAQQYLNSFGITSVTMATGSLADVELYGQLRDRGKLTVRTRTAFGAVAVNQHLTRHFLEQLETARTKYHDPWVSANLVKFFSDGLADPPLYTLDEFRKIVLELDKRGFQVMTHSIGFDSARMVLDAYQAVEKINGPRDRRLRMEHADFLNFDDIPRLARLSVIANMQPGFCCTPADYGPANIDVWNSLFKAGTMVTFSSDWPCTWPPDPFSAMQEALTREIIRDVTPNGPAGDILYGKLSERVTIEQAVRAYTRDAAYANFAETRTGTLEPGKLADLAVLSQDIFATKPRDLGKTRVTMTMVGGRIVFQR